MAAATYNRFGNFQELINWRRLTDAEKKSEPKLALAGGEDGLIRYALAIGKNRGQQPVVLEETCRRGRGAAPAPIAVAHRDAPAFLDAAAALPAETL